jgi:hypothetical protein
VSSKCPDAAAQRGRKLQWVTPCRAGCGSRVGGRPSGRGARTMDHQADVIGTDERAPGQMRRASSPEASGTRRDASASIAAISGERDESPPCASVSGERIRSLRLHQWVSSKDLRGARTSNGTESVTPRTAGCVLRRRKDLVVQDRHFCGPPPPRTPRNSLTSMGEQPECGAQCRQSATDPSRG